MNLSFKTLPLIKLENIEYPQKFINIFLNNFSKKYINELLLLRDAIPNIPINIIVNTKISNSLYFSLSIVELDLLFSNDIYLYSISTCFEDMLAIDYDTFTNIININDSLYLNTNNIKHSYEDYLIPSCYLLSIVEKEPLNSINSYINYISNLNEIQINNILFDNTLNNIELLPNDIPQFSNFNNSTINLTNNLSTSNSALTFNEIGLILTEEGKNDAAYKKYGENQSKTAELLELVSISSSVPKKVSLTPLGQIFNDLDSTTRNSVLFYQILKTNIIKQIINLANFNNEILLSSLCTNTISIKTYIRRRSNIKCFISILKEKNIETLNNTLSKIKY